MGRQKEKGKISESTRRLMMETAVLIASLLPGDAEFKIPDDVGDEKIKKQLEKEVKDIKEIGKKIREMKEGAPRAKRLAKKVGACGGCISFEDEVQEELIWAPISKQILNPSSETWKKISEIYYEQNKRWYNYKNFADAIRENAKLLAKREYEEGPFPEDPLTYPSVAKRKGLRPVVYWKEKIIPLKTALVIDASGPINDEEIAKGIEELTQYHKIIDLKLIIFHHEEPYGVFYSGYEFLDAWSWEEFKITKEEFIINPPKTSYIKTYELIDEKYIDDIDIVFHVTDGVNDEKLSQFPPKVVEKLFYILTSPLANKEYRIPERHVFAWKKLGNF